MAPRRYRLGRRGDAADETRQRIVEATFALHAEQGIAATTMKQIAARADVSIGAVYHHFPTYEDAVKACGRFTQETIPLPTREIFADAPSPEARVKAMAHAVFDFFQRLPVLERVRCDQHLMPVLRQFVEAEEARRLELARAALQGLDVAEETIQVAAAVLDFAVFSTLRRAGFAPEAAAEEVARLILARVAPGPMQEPRARPRTRTMEKRR